MAPHVSDCCRNFVVIFGRHEEFRSELYPSLETCLGKPGSQLHTAHTATQEMKKRRDIENMVGSNHERCNLYLGSALSSCRTRFPGTCLGAFYPLSVVHPDTRTKTSAHRDTQPTNEPRGSRRNRNAVESTVLGLHSEPVPAHEKLGSRYTAVFGRF